MSSTTKGKTTVPLVEDDEKRATTVETATLLKNRLLYIGDNNRFPMWSMYIYVSLFEPLLLGWMIAQNFLGWVPTLDYYFSIIVHIIHCFAWAAIVTCKARNFSLAFFRGVMVIYGFAVILDLAGFIWRLVTTLVCNPVAGSTCDEYYGWGLAGSLFSIILFLASLVNFISMRFLIKHLIDYTQRQEKKIAVLLDEANSQTQSQSTSTTNVRDQNTKSTYSRALECPPYMQKFRYRKAIFFVGICEAILFFTAFFFAMFGFVVSATFLWSMYLQCLHFFMFIFLVASVYYVYSKRFHQAVIVIYALMVVLDTVGFVWRSILLIECDPNVDVDCIFRSIPGWFPIQTCSAILIIIDVVALASLIALYRWLWFYVWKPLSEISQSVGKLLDNLNDDDNDDFTNTGASNVVANVANAPHRSRTHVTSTTRGSKKIN